MPWVRGALCFLASLSLNRRTKSWLRWIKSCAVCGFDSRRCGADPSMPSRRNQNTVSHSGLLGGARCVQQIPAARFMDALSLARTHSFPHLSICQAKCEPHGFFAAAAAACTAAADAAATAPADATAGTKKQPAELWTCLLELQWDSPGLYSLVEFFSSLVGSAFSFMLLVIVYVLKWFSPLCLWLISMHGFTET